MKPKDRNTPRLAWKSIFICISFAVIQLSFGCQRLNAQPTLNCPTCTNNNLNGCSGENLSNYIDVTGETGSVTYTVTGDVANPGTQNNLNSFVLSDINPSGSGSIDLVVNAGNGNLTETININFVNIVAGFTHIQTNTATCYSIDFTNASSVSSGFSIDNYSWDFGFTTSNLIDPVITFPGPGSYCVSLVATDATYDCSNEFSTIITVNGPQALLELFGNSFPLQVMPPDDICTASQDTCIFPFCISTSAAGYDLEITDASFNNGGGGNSTFVFDDLQVPGVQTLPYTINFPNDQASTGYYYFKYTVTDDLGCVDTKVYAVYRSTTQQLQFTCSQANNTPYCVGDIIPFATAAWQNVNPADATYQIQFICDATGEILFDQTWQDIPPTTFNFTPTITSCGCNNFNSFTIISRVSSPCDQIIQPTANNFTADFTSEADFEITATPPACLGESLSFDWLFDNGAILSSGSLCHPLFNWTITDLSNSTNINPASGDFTAHMDHTFNAAGSYEVKLLVSTCISDTFIDTVCVFPTINQANLNLNFTWGIPAAPLCVPETITPNINSFNNNLCSPPTFTWRLFLLPDVSIPVASGTGLSPDFPIAVKGEYRLVLTAQVENCGSFDYQEDFTVGNKPLITATNPVFNACGNNTSICLDDLFCIDTCFNSLSQFTIAVYQGIVNCSAPAGVPVYTNVQLPQQHILDCSASLCQYLWNLPANPGTTYTVVINATNGCGAAIPKCVTINIGAQLQANIPDFVCTDSVLNLSAFFPAGETNCYFEQFIGNAWVPINNSFTVSQESIIKLSCDDGCPLQDTIDVFAPFTLNAAVNPAMVCAGNDVVITINPLPANTVMNTYSFTNGVVVQSGVANSYTAQDVQTDVDYTITAYDVNGCHANTSAIIVVEELPDFTCSGFIFCESDLASEIDFTLLLNIAGVYPASTQWSINGTTINATSITVDEILILFPMAGVTQFLDLAYDFTSTAGCHYSDTCSVTIEYQGTSVNTVQHLCADIQFEILQAVIGEWTMNDLPVSAGTDFTGDTFQWTPLPTDTGTYTLQFNSGCSVTNYPLQVHYFTVEATANDTIVCTDTPVTLDAVVVPATTSVISFQWDMHPSSLTPSFNEVISVDSTYYLLATDNFNCIATDSIRIDVEELPVFSCTSIDPLYCETSVDLIYPENLLLFEGSYPALAVWSVSNIVIPSASFQVVDLVELIGGINSDTTVYLLNNFITINGCIYSDSCAIQLENEDLEILHYDVCTDSIIVLPGNGYWDSDDLPASAQPTGNANGFTWEIDINDPAGEYILYFGAGCGLTEHHIHLYTTPNPAITLSGDVLCLEGNVNVNTTAIVADNLEYTYTNEDGIISLGNTLDVFSPSGILQNTSPGVICLLANKQYNLPNGDLLICAAQDCEDVDIIDLPGIPSNENEFCFEEEIFIQGVFDSFEWEVNNVTYDSNPIVLNDLTGSQAFELFIHYGGTYNCQVDTSGFLFIHEPIEANFVLLSDSCTGQATVSIEIIQGENLEYTFIGDAQIIGSNGIHAGLNNLQFNTTISDDTNFPFSITITNGGCNTLTWEEEVLIYASPNLILDVAAGSVLCNGEEVCLDAINTGSASITDIQFDMGNGTTYNFLPEPVEIPCTSYNAALFPVTYTITGIMQGFCETNVVNLDIIIEPSDVLVQLGDYTDGFCPGDTIDISPSSINGSGPFVTDYTFSPGFTPEFIGDDHIIMPYGYSDVNIQLSISVDGLCGADSDDTYFYVKPTPITHTDHTAACQGKEVEFTNQSVPLQGDFRWYVLGEDTVSANIHFNYTFPDDSEYQVILSQQIEGECIGYDSLLIDVHVDPVPVIGLNNKCFLEGYTTVNMSTQPGMAQYLWYVDGDPYNVSDATVSFTPNDISPGDTLFSIYLVVTDTNGCVGQAIKEIVQCEAPIIYVPNSFTPDYDGINDVFCVSVINAVDFQMWIYDRWGNEVYYSTDPSTCWTGEYQGGEYFVSNDVYEWKIIYNKKPGSEDKLFRKDEEKWEYPPLYGHVTILR